MTLAMIHTLILTAIRVTMPQSRMRTAGVLLLGFALAVPFELAAQQPAAAPASTPTPDAAPIKKVVPKYPLQARSEYPQGTVRIHAIIGRDGSIQSLQVVSGVCSLARSAVEAAVEQWRYSPTLLNGKPVEVDTTIDLIYSLGR